ncbi:hypothetical protein Hdeb2414_s0028g00701781 [Helianthus debilis subsp. tardiflorus]
MAQHTRAAKLVRQRWGSSSEGGEHSHGDEVCPTTGCIRAASECVRQVVYSPGA